MLLDQAFGVAVDDAVDRAAGLDDLTLEGVELEPTRAGLYRVEAPLVLLQDPRRVLQQPADLVPDGRVERLDRDQPGVAAELAVEPAAIGAAAPVLIFRHYT